MKPIAAVGAVSKRYGVDFVMLFEQSVNQVKFIEFLVKLRQKYPFRKMALFIDNLTAHKTKKVIAKYKELQFATVFNVP